MGHDTEIRYALVHLSHPTIEKLFTESNVLYGVEGDFNVFIPRSQVVNVNFDIDILDWDSEAGPQPAESERPL